MLVEAQTQLNLSSEKERNAVEKHLTLQSRVGAMEAQLVSLRQEKSQLLATLELERAKLETMEDGQQRWGKEEGEERCLVIRNGALCSLELTACIFSSREYSCNQFCLLTIQGVSQNWGSPLLLPTVNGGFEEGKGIVISLCSYCAVYTRIPLTILSSNITTKHYYKTLLQNVNKHMQSCYVDMLITPLLAGDVGASVGVWESEAGGWE